MAKKGTPALAPEKYNIFEALRMQGILKALIKPISTFGWRRNEDDNNTLGHRPGYPRWYRRARKYEPHSKLARRIMNFDKGKIY